MELTVFNILGELEGEVIAGTSVTDIKLDKCWLNRPFFNGLSKLNNHLHCLDLNGSIWLPEMDLFTPLAHMQLKHLYLSDSQIWIHQLWALACNDMLQTIIAKNCMNMFDEHVDTIRSNSNSFKNLTLFDLTGCQNLTKRGVLELASMLPSSCVVKFDF